MIKNPIATPDKIMTIEIVTFKNIPNWIILPAFGLRPKASTPLRASFPKNKNAKPKHKNKTPAATKYLTITEGWSVEAIKERVKISLRAGVSLLLVV